MYFVYMYRSQHTHIAQHLTQYRYSTVRPPSPAYPAYQQASYLFFPPVRCGKNKSNGQNRVHPEARWPQPGTPFHASPSFWPTPAQTRLWQNLKRVHPILATHPPIGYPISITPTRLWPGYSTSSPHAHASWRHRGTRRVIFAVDVVVRAAEL